MKLKRILCAFLVLTMAVGMLSNFSFTVSAAKEEKEVLPDATAYLTNSYRSPDAKLETMTQYLENEKYIFYVDPVSGEFALKNKNTNQILFSNPYDAGSSNASEDMKKQLLSQIIINYSLDGVAKQYTSFTDCACRNQIKVKQMKNGVRVEYTIGNEETRKLLPMMITKEKFESVIAPAIESGSRSAWRKFEAFYQKKDLNDPTLSTSSRAAMEESYPITKKYAVYVFSTDATEQEKTRMENYIKTYVPDYTFEDLEEDHEKVGYVAKEQAPAVFKLALEYSIDEQGLNMRLGANGLRFDETVYTLDNIKVLPYVGAGSSDNNGYIFVPDGSGAIMRFEDITASITLASKLYGQDYAYHTVNGTTQESMRMPVYGIVEQKTRKVENEQTGELDTLDLYSGYLAIIEEGDSLASLYAETGGTMHKYNTAYTAFYPRPSDQYNLADSISVGSNATWTVVSDRKYTGNYKIKYVILDDPILAEEQGTKDKENYYEASYVGMAKAYRDYLLKKGDLTLLTKEDVKNDIPLYIESFGTIDTEEKILSFPVTVETPLTTFDDLVEMTNALEESGISNINYRLTGFTNGGLTSTVPSKADFQSKAGGNKGYKKFLSYADEKGVGVYPDFDMCYVHDTGAFDGFSFNKDAVRTIDNRYTQKQEYNYVYQVLESTDATVISVSVFEKLYKKLSKDLMKLGTTGISVSTLGSDLNSDFNTDDPYNREDARAAVVDLLEKIDNDFGSVMTNEGNAYCLKYVDHILNVSLDSSRYISSSQSVPFVGLVLHGSVQFAGSPLNMVGDAYYEMLKIIENGASPYFMLSYENTAKLKEDALLSEYYSVAFQIWQEDLVKYYNTLNDALKDCQTSQIENHEFVEAERVATDEEKAADAKALEEAIAQDAISAVHTEEKARRAEVMAAKKAAKSGQEQQQAAAAEATEENAAQTEKEDIIDLKTKYKTEKGTVVKVTYTNGKTFILNYNSFDIVYEGTTVSALGFAVIK